MFKIETAYGEFWSNSRRKAWAVLINRQPLRHYMDERAPGAVRAYASAESAELAARKYLRGAG
jgi:hypothetical protein